MPEEKYCYFVDHDEYGYRVFYHPYNLGLAAELAIAYADNRHSVFKLPLIDSELPAQNLSAQFNAIAKPTVELPAIPVEAMLSSVG